MDEYSVQKGLFSRLRIRLSQVDQRTAFDAFIVFLILIGLAASVYLAGQRQIFRSGAAQNGSAEVVDEQGNAVPKEGENFIVETQQIRIKINIPTEWGTPQGTLPNHLISSAYAQQGLCGSTWTDGRLTSCYPDTSAPASGCDYLWAWSRDDSNPNKESSTCGTDAPYCWACPVQQPTPTPASSQPITSRPVITRTNLILNSILEVWGENFGEYRGIVYYSRGGSTEERVFNISSWRNTSFMIEQTSNPVKITPGSYLRVCRKTDAQCSDYTVIEQGGAAAPTPTPTSTPVPAQNCGTAVWEGKRTLCSAEDNPSGCTYLDDWSRPLSKVCPASTPFCWACPEPTIGTPQPTATPPQPTTSQQPPTATPEQEQIGSIRISLNEANVRSGNCFREPGGPGVGSPSPSEHCMEFSITDPYFTQRGNMADLWLPNEAGTYPIYIGFVSNKGNLKPGLLSVKVNYRPKQISPSPRAAGSPTSQTISGKLKIIANGQRYKDVWISVFKIKSENPVELDLEESRRELKNFNFSFPLPTDQDQEGNFSMANLTDSKYVLVANLFTEDGKHISGIPKVDCPNSLVSNSLDFLLNGCLVQTGATDANLTLTIPPAGQATASPTPTITLTNCDQLYKDCMNTVEATKETCDRTKASCESLKTGVPTPTPSWINPPYLPDWFKPPSTPTPTPTIKRCDEVRGVCAKSDTGESFTEILFCSGSKKQGNYSCPIGYECFEQNSCREKEDARTPTPIPTPTSTRRLTEDSPELITDIVFIQNVKSYPVFFKYIEENIPAPIGSWHYSKYNYGGGFYLYPTTPQRYTPKCSNPQLSRSNRINSENILQALIEYQIERTIKVTYVDKGEEKSVEGKFKCGEKGLITIE